MHKVAEYFPFEMFFFCKRRQGNERGEGEESRGERRRCWEEGGGGIAGNGSRTGTVFITLPRLTLSQKLMNNIPVCQLVCLCVCVWWSRRSHGLSYCLSCRALSLWGPLGSPAKQKWPRKTGHPAVETSEYQGSNSVHISPCTAWLCLPESFEHSPNWRGQTSSHLIFVLWNNYFGY